MKRSIKQITVTALGIGMYIVFTAVFRIPFFENLYLAMGYVVLAVYSYSVGLVEAVHTGFLGTLMYCLLFSSVNGMPGWSLGNLLICGLLYYLFAWYRKTDKGFISTVITIALIVAITALGIVGAKSVVEIFLYRQPFLVRVAKNAHAFVADAITLVLGFFIARRTDKMIRSRLQ